MKEQLSEWFYPQKPSISLNNYINLSTKHFFPISILTAGTGAGYLICKIL